MKKLIEFALGKASKFGILDYGIFKLCLFTLGVIFGAYFSSFFLEYISIVWILFIVSYIYLMYKIFIKK